MNRIIFLVIYLTVNNIVAQDVSVSFFVKNTTLSSIEPLFYEIKIINNGSIAKKISTPWSLRTCPILQFYDKRSNEWMMLKSSNRTNYDRFPLVAGGGFTSDNSNKGFLIKPKQNIKHNFVYVPFDNYDYTSKEYYFENGDTLNLRVAYVVNTKTEEIIYSNNQILIINDDIEIDKDALLYIKKLFIPHFLFEIAIFDPTLGAHPSPSLIKFTGVTEAKYIIANYPNSKFAAWADLHLAWNESLAADKNIIEAQYGLAQDSTLALNNAKEQLINAETYLESALEGNNPLVRPYVKQLYYTIVENKFRLGLYVDLEEYFKALEYVDSL